MASGAFDLGKCPSLLAMLVSCHVTHCSLGGCADWQCASMRACGLPNALH